MIHTKFYEDAVDRAGRPGKTHEDRVEIMLGVIAESLAAIADSLESIEGSLESISDKMWENSDL
jgi:hypothetical protein